MAIKKQCAICKQYKCRTKFMRDKTQLDGKNQVCMECVRKIKSETPVKQCVVPGCDKNRAKASLCRRHFMMWVKHEITHPLKGEYTKKGPKPKFQSSSKPIVPDGRKVGICKRCCKKTRVNHWGYCFYCWSVKSSCTAGDEWIKEPTVNPWEMRTMPTGGWGKSCNI